MHAAPSPPLQLSTAADENGHELDLDAAGGVLVTIAAADMGQHVGTALARIVADELGADWGAVTIKHVDSDPKWG